MRKISIVEPNRIKSGPFSSSAEIYPCGAYRFFNQQTGNELHVIVGDGFGWEHVSVSCERHTPKWEDMQFIKEKFWADDETVVQFHPKKSEYVNKCVNCLHMWRKTGEDYELPAREMVG